MDPSKAPCNTNDQELKKRILLTTGMVTLPGPFPELGEVFLEENAFTFGSVPQDVVCLRECPDPYSVVERRVLLRDVVAIFVPDREKEEVDMNSGKFAPGEEAADLIKCLREQGSVRGMIFVREDTPVAMWTLSGMTASDSQAYSWCGPGCDTKVGLRAVSDRKIRFARRSESHQPGTTKMDEVDLVVLSRDEGPLDEAVLRAIDAQQRVRIRFTA